MTGRDAEREQLASAVAQHRLVTPRQCFCGEREPYDERDAGFHRPEWHIAHVLTALLPVVDRIANERAAATLEAAADDFDPRPALLAHPPRRCPPRQQRGRAVTAAAGSPGTYGPTPPRHPWTPLPPEPGAHARCTHCTQPRHEHEETAR